MTLDLGQLEEGLGYFNLEVSPERSILSSNGNREGLNWFIEEYGHLASPPNQINFINWQRSQKVWSSGELIANESSPSKNPSPYQADLRAVWNERNCLLPSLEVCLRNDVKDEVVFLAARDPRSRLLDCSPILVVNQAGWQQFLAIICYLRDESDWFYVTSVESRKLFKKIRSDFFGCRRTQIEVNLEKLARSVCASRRKKRPNLFEEFMRLDTSIYPDECWSSLPFRFYPPFPPDELKPLLFNAIECIRLEPKNIPYLRIEMESEDSWCDLVANSEGFLLFAQWVRDFIKSGKRTEKFLNSWNNKYASPRNKEGIKENPLHWVNFERIEASAPVAFAIGTEKGDLTHVHFLGDKNGLEELAEIAEFSAFGFDHDFFASDDDFDHGLGRHQRGALLSKIKVSENIALTTGCRSGRIDKKGEPQWQIP